MGSGFGEKESGEKKQTYRWNDHKGQMREIQLSFPDPFLAESLKIFGVPSSSRHNPQLLLRKGFKLVERRHSFEQFSGKIIERLNLRIDYESLFRSFREKMAPYARLLYTLEFDQEGMDPLRHFLDFVQQIPYKRPPEVYKGRYINGYFVPPICLAEGYGDCDSKVILLADLMAAGWREEEKLALALINGKGIAHTILLVQRPQLPGMSSIYSDKHGRFLPVETTTAGWNPGFISPVLADLLKEGLFDFVSF